MITFGISPKGYNRRYPRSDTIVSLSYRFHIVQIAQIVPIVRFLCTACVQKRGVLGLCTFVQKTKGEQRTKMKGFEWKGFYRTWIVRLGLTNPENG